MCLHCSGACPLEQILKGGPYHYTSQGKHYVAAIIIAWSKHVSMTWLLTGAPSGGLISQGDRLSRVLY